MLENERYFPIKKKKFPSKKIWRIIINRKKTRFINNRFNRFISRWTTKITLSDKNSPLEDALTNFDGENGK